MKSYADDLPNADTVVRAIQEENNKVVTTLLDSIHNIKDIMHSEITETRTARNEDISRIDELIRQIRIANEEQRKTNKSTSVILGITFVLQAVTIGGLAYYFHTLGIL